MQERLLLLVVNGIPLARLAVPAADFIGRIPGEVFYPEVNFRMRFRGSEPGILANRPEISGFWSLKRAVLCWPAANRLSEK
jgi:hypothetical protein